jgi:hypothetical protein
MPIYKLIRHVVYFPTCQETREVWGIDRAAPGLRTMGAPQSTDADDPLGTPCSLLLLMHDGDYVTWTRIPEWISEAEEAGYEVVGGLHKLSPYTTILVRGPAASALTG